LYKSVVASTAKKGYRADLRQDAVARASAVKLSQRDKKPAPAAKLRGAKAKKAASS
jgi:large subunit ribosomal protein L28e